MIFIIITIAAFCSILLFVLSTIVKKDNEITKERKEKEEKIINILKNFILQTNNKTKNKSKLKELIFLYDFFIYLKNNEELKNKYTTSSGFISVQQINEDYPQSKKILDKLELNSDFNWDINYLIENIKKEILEFWNWNLIKLIENNFQGVEDLDKELQELKTQIEEGNPYLLTLFKEKKWELEVLKDLLEFVKKAPYNLEQKEKEFDNFFKLYGRVSKDLEKLEKEVKPIVS